MSKRPAASESDAAALAAWVRLPLETIRMIYVSQAVAGAKDWRTLEADAALDEALGDLQKRLLTQAFDEAEPAGFLLELAISLSKLEQDSGRSQADIGILLSSLGSGQMQAVTNRAAGLMEHAIFLPLHQVGEASAYVSSGQQIIGTAFLVAPDLVLTSAHVALEGGKAGVFSSKLKPGLRFTSMSGKRTPARQPVDRTAVGDKPVAYSPPHGTPPDKMRRSLGAAAAKNLDYALVRLSSQVTHVPHLDISEPGVGEGARRCFVIGYAGGTAVLFDVDLVQQVDLESARLMHLANTIAGMSGSCCIGPAGKPVALHEGGFYKRDEHGKKVVIDGKEVVEHNRAVCLTNIRDALRAMKPDPLVARPHSPGFGIFDPNLLVAWNQGGQRLAGADLEPTWNQAVADALGADFNAVRDALGFHPWFTRKALEDWIHDRSNAVNRVAFINGGPGTGKSFCVQILAAKLSFALRDLVVLTPTQTTAWSWSEAVAKLPRADAGNSRLRTDAGAVKYEDVAPIIAGLRAYGGGDRTEGENPLFVAIDFEGAKELGSEAPPWREFVKQLASHPWVRLMIIGLSEGERATLDSILANEAATASVFPVQIDLQHAGLDELKQFLQTLYRDRGQEVTKLQVDKLLRPWSASAGLRQNRGQMQTVEAVLVALTAYKAAGAAETGGGG